MFLIRIFVGDKTSFFLLIFLTKIWTTQPFHVVAIAVLLNYWSPVLLVSWQVILMDGDWSKEVLETRGDVLESETGLETETRPHRGGDERGRERVQGEV